LWSRRGERIAIFDVSSPVYHVRFSPDDHTIIASCENGQIYLWPTLPNIKDWVKKDTIVTRQLFAKTKIDALKTKYYMSDSIWEDFVKLWEEFYGELIYKTKELIHRFQ
jgi:WD40 repeat protein